MNLFINPIPPKGLFCEREQGNGVITREGIVLREVSDSDIEEHS